MKLVDAIHFSAALERGCDVFVTNDSRIRSSGGLEVVLLESL
jgi:predicted nucleic acid-binding protein